MANIKEILNNWRNFSFGPFFLSMMDGQSLGKTLIKATLGSAGVRIAGMFVTFFLGVLLARFMGVEQYGIYGTVMSIMAIMAVPAQFGLPQLATKEISVAHGRRDFDQIRTVFFWFLGIICLGSIIAVVIGYLIRYLWEGDQSISILSAYYWGLGLVPLIAVLSFGTGALLGMNQVVGAQIYDTLLKPVLMVLLLLSMILSGSSIDAKTVFIFQVISGIIAIIICSLHLRKKLPPAFFAAAINKFEPTWLKTSTPMATTEVFRVIGGNYPILLLGLLATIVDVGLFRVAIAIVAFVGFPSSLLNLVVMPYVANAYAQNDKITLQKLATYTALASFVCTATIMLFVYFFGEVVISFLFGEEYSGAWLILILIGIAYLINSFFGSLATILNMCGGEREVAFAFLIGPVVGICISIILFPYYQSYAVAIAMIIAELIRNLWMSYVAKYKLRLDVSILSILKFR